MKRLKQVVTLFTAAAMTVSLLAGCGSSSGDNSSASTSASSSSAATTATSGTADPLKEHVDLSVALWSIGEALVDGEDEIRDTIYKKLNITIKPMNITWNDYKNKVMVWAASSQLPDIFAYDAIGYSTYKDWIKQGIVRPVPDDLSAYPNVKSIMEDKGSEVFKYPAGDANAKYYAVPRLNHKSSDDWCTDVGIQIRKDWMANVGVTKDPETLDEFIDLMLKFVNNDPDKNGKKDTIGLTGYQLESLRAIIMSYEPGFEGWVKDEENPGQWIPGWMSKKSLEGLKAVNKLYSVGALDKDFATLKGEEGQDKFVNGKAGAYAHDVIPGTLYYMADKYAKVSPGKKYSDAVKIMHPLKASDGKVYRYTQVPFWSETYINADCDDVKTDRALRLLDYFLSDEGYNLIHYGIEGKDWKKNGDSIELIPHKDASGADLSLDKIYPIAKISFFAEWSGTRQWDSPTRYPDLQQISKEERDWQMSNAEVGTVDRRVSYLDCISNSKTNIQLKDVIVKCMLSKDIEKTFNDIVKSQRAGGYDKLIKDVNAEAAGAGIK